MNPNVRETAPPRKDCVENLARAKLLKSYTPEFAKEAPHAFHAFVANIGIAMEKDKGATA